MRRIRVIPALLLRRGGLVKGQQFKNHKYVGDPINSVKIFNEKEVDELVFLDITATSEGRPPNFELLQDIASEAFMPFGYGGGISCLEHVEKILALGIEKVVINTAAYEKPDFLKTACATVGSQSVVGSIDFRHRLLQGNTVYIRSGQKQIKVGLVDYAKSLEDLGVGEILLTNIAQEGSRNGFKTEMIAEVANAVSIPIVASGGAGSIDDFRQAITEGKASAISAGEMFTFYGKHRAVLINYPSIDELKKFYESI
jgi:imidazole glycerol-phosphate synthase subunit HisF